MRRKTITAVAGVTAVTAALVTGGSALAAPAAATKPITVTVTMKEYSFKLSKPSIPKGSKVIFKVVNKGSLPHDWDLEGTKGTAVIGPGRTVTQTVTLSTAGSFRYICTVPRHASFGMDGNLKVK